MSFINEDFMLSGQTAGELYHEAAEGMPIIDYHCHLIPQMIAENHQFRDITVAGRRPLQMARYARKRRS